MSGHVLVGTNWVRVWKIRLERGNIVVRAEDALQYPVRMFPGMRVVLIGQDRQKVAVVRPSGVKEDDLAAGDYLILDLELRPEDTEFTR